MRVKKIGNGKMSKPTQSKRQKRITTKLLPYQVEFHKDKTTKRVWLIGGIGTGKSEAIGNDIILMAMGYPGIEILLTANTYTQLMNATVSKLVRLLNKYKIKYTMVRSGAEKNIKFLGCTVYLYSLENYDNIRGIEVGVAYVDEVAFTCREAIDVLDGRLRAKIGTLQIKGASSPNGFNFLYDECVGKDINPTANVKYIKGLTEQNRFLPKGTFERLLESYGGKDTPLAKQELYGEFVNMMGGQIYGGFKRETHCKPLILDRNHPVYVGVDFNIDKMSATYNQYINGIHYCIKEIQLTHSGANTLDLGSRIIRDLIGYNVLIIPDSTGKNRHSSATSTQSDHAVLTSLGLRLMPTSNPYIRDRQNTVNNLFYKNQLWIDPSCVETIKEIETLSNREQEGKVAHLSVTMGYVIWKLNPLIMPTNRSTTIQF